MYSFKAIIASRGYHVYKETSWSKAKLNEEVKVELEKNTISLSTDPYACAIKIKNPYFNDWKTVGHIPREISRYVYFFIKQESGNVSGTLKSLKYKPSPIPSGGLEVPLLLKFSARDKWVVDTMEEFVLNFYSYEYTGNFSIDDNEDDDDEDYQTIIIESNETEIQETETQSEIQATGSQDTGTESQSSDIDLQINVPVQIIID